METISLKALARKVLHVNSHGNKMETKAGTDTQKMPLSEFEKAGLILKVWSEVLKEHVYFVSSEAIVRLNPLDAVAYTAQELQAMFDMDAKEVSAVHELKRLFHKARVIEHSKTAYG